MNDTGHLIIDELDALILAAEAGDANAQNDLGSMLLNGIGCAADAEAARHWYELSAKQGLATAQYNLGKRYLDGNGAESDDRQAFYWLERAAQQGHTEATCEFGTMYRFGRGTETNPLRGAQYHILAAEAGDRLAMENLRDEHTSLVDLAFEGSREAAFALFQMSQGGFGVEKSAATAWSWLRWAYDGCDTESTDVWLDNRGLIDAMNFYLAILNAETRKKGDQILANHIATLGGPLEGKQRIILKVGAEGGSMTIIGRWSPSGWRYWFSVNESMWEFEFEDQPFVPRKATEHCSWRAALKAIDRYPWHKLVPLQAHPDFSSRILRAWRSRSRVSGEYIGEREWARVCGCGTADV